MERRIFMNKKTLIIAVSVLLVLVLAFAAVWFIWGEKAMAGSKEITIEVIAQDGSSTVYEVKTTAEYLQGAMDEAKGLSYETAEDGMVMVVNGVRADYVKDGAYWGFYVNDGYCNYGIDAQPIADGDAFRIEYTPA